MLPQEIYFKNGKRAVLLLHAYTGSPNDVRMLARQLEKENYTVLAPLFSGHGTPDPMNILHMTPDIWLNDAKKALKKLQDDGYVEIAVFGLSMGGVIAMTLLGENPDLFVGGGSFSSPLVPESTNQIYPNFLKYCEFMYKKITNSPEELEEKMNMVKMPLKVQLEQVFNLSKIAFDGLSNIDKPIYVAQSGQDEMFDGSSIYEIGNQLKGTYHQIIWYPNSTHVITVSKDRKQFEGDIVAFLSHIKWNEE
ncbi:alpha/beta hydrolase [Vagococcus fluvialis]|uniref:alpha/beta hydrolase n=1 Tax=Vagococcus fluvialis TaxID=2738 RepID=UPI001D0AEEA9|nr:alpha/beta fold hydrolase [Vagococcus fluvialis]UDM77846.1 alpha/beta hydrolase [Vagococcus fluvialis]UDM82116.1 alpha/beta hydrolase [Vagococcus fluvialis]